MGLLDLVGGTTGSGTLAGDVTGTISANKVVALTGSAGTVSIHATGKLSWDAGSTTPGLTQVTTSSNPVAMTIASQATTNVTPVRGGNITYNTGVGTFFDSNWSEFVAGYHDFQFNGHSMVQIGQYLNPSGPLGGYRGIYFPTVTTSFNSIIMESTSYIGMTGGFHLKTDADFTFGSLDGLGVGGVGGIWSYGTRLAYDNASPPNLTLIKLFQGINEGLMAGTTGSGASSVNTQTRSHYILSWTNQSTTNASVTLGTHDFGNPPINVNLAGLANAGYSLKGTLSARNTSTGQSASATITPFHVKIISSVASGPASVTPVLDTGSDATIGTALTAGLNIGYATSIGTFTSIGLSATNLDWQMRIEFEIC